MVFSKSWKLTALAIVGAFSQRSVDAFALQRPITTNQQHRERPNSGSELYVEQRVSYSKGAEIFPPCNQKEFTLADSFPEGLIPEAAKFILEQKEPSILQQIESAALDTNDSSRRDFVKAAAAVVTLPALATLASPSEFMNGISKHGNTMNLSQAIDWIENNCDKRFIHAVVASDYNFLYYGLDQNAKETIRVESLQKLDLLDLDTYGSNDAVEYFQNLESLLANDVVKPSNGHLMTTSSKDATNWGTAYSMWPIGDVHYAWFQSKGLFYPRSSVTALTRDDIIVDGRDCGKDSLDDALTANGCEVLVSGQRYMAVPASMDNELRQALKDAFLI